LPARSRRRFGDRIAPSGFGSAARRSGRCPVGGRAGGGPRDAVDGFLTPEAFDAAGIIGGERDIGVAGGC